MSAHKWHYYDENQRRSWQNPEAILNHIGLKAGQTLIDIGCGQGFFSLPAARQVGPQGLVHAIDSNPEAMALLKQRAAQEGLKNIHLTVREAEAGPVCQGCADFIFFGIVLHDFRDPLTVLQNARQMLKTSGRLINLDWKKEPMSLGPPLEIRFDPGMAASLMRKAGLEIHKTEEYGPYTYLITAVLA